MFARKHSLEIGCFLFLVLLTWYQTFSPPVLGMADNGDFARVMARFGMAQAAGSYEDRYLSYVNRTFPLDPKVHWELRSLFDGFFSSENFLVAMALTFNRAIPRYSGFVDIRMLAAIHAGLFLSGILLALTALSRRPWTIRIAACLAMLLIYSDGTYTAYFNSIYCEAGVLGFFVLTLAAAIAMIERGEIRSGKLPVLFAVAGLCLALEKNVYFIFGLFVLAFGIRLTCLDHNATRRKATIAAGAVAAAASLLYFNHAPLDMREAYQYNMIFMQILPSSTDPDTDLRALGLDPELRAYSGTYAYQPGIDFGSAYFQQKLYGRVGFRTVFQYYAMHPSRALPLIAAGLDWGWRNVPLKLGNFEKSAGRPPGAQSTTWRLWSGAKAQLSSLGWIWSIVLTVATLICNRMLRARTADRRTRLYCDLQVSLAVLAALQGGLIVFSQGTIDLDRKFFLFNLLVDTILVINFCAAVEWLRARLGTP